jgi:hypothetical protein
LTFPAMTRINGGEIRMFPKKIEPLQ